MSETKADDGKMRIAKRMARAGACSRREAEGLIGQGRVTLNGKPVETPATLVDEQDVIAIDGEAIEQTAPTALYRYHKPRGLLTATRDPQGRPTIFDRLPQNLPRLMPVGRLDLNSEGLLLLTNDGALKRYLELPETGWARRYRVRVFGRLDDQALADLKNGVTIEGIRYGAIDVTIEPGEKANRWLRVGLREGKNREIRKVLGHVGLEVSRLIRIAYGPFQLGGLKSTEIEQVKGKVLREQLGSKFPLAA